MDDQLTIDTGEITTSPGLIAQNSTDYSKSSARAAARRKTGFFARLWPLMQAYGASLVSSYAIFPTVATIFTVVFYLAMSGVSGWQIVAWGVIVTVIAWLAISILLTPFTSARASNPQNCGLIESRLSRLETRLYVLQTTTSEDQLKQYQRVALEEAYDNLSKLQELMYSSTSRLPWVVSFPHASTRGNLEV
jgi:hypothetical protein